MVNQVFLVALAMIAVVLATARTTRLLTTDRIAAGYRDWVEERFGDPTQFDLSYVLIMCNWCNSFWTGLFWNAWMLGASAWLADLDWRAALLSLPPLTMATSYAASRLLESEGN